MAKHVFCGIVLNLVIIFSAGWTQAVLSPLWTPASPSIWETNNLPTLVTRRYNRFEPPGMPDRICEEAQSYLKKIPYKWGGSLQKGKGSDCSGFVQFIYGKEDISLPRVCAQQIKMGSVAATSMDFSKLEAGDLLFFRSKKRPIDHVGIYLGDGKMIHNAKASHGVTVSDLNRPYYRQNFVVAKRVYPPAENSAVSAVRKLFNPVALVH